MGPGDVCATTWGVYVVQDSDKEFIVYKSEETKKVYCSCGCTNKCEHIACVKEYLSFVEEWIKKLSDDAKKRTKRISESDENGVIGRTRKIMVSFPGVGEREIDSSAYKARDIITLYNRRGTCLACETRVPNGGLYCSDTCFRRIVEKMKIIRRVRDDLYRSQTVEIEAGNGREVMSLARYLGLEDKQC